METLKIISYSVRGPHNPAKRKKILHQLKQARCQVAFLQKTHLPDVEHEKLRKSWADKVHYSSHQSRKKGLTILIHRGVNFTQTSVRKDREGRYIVVNGLIDGIEVSLMNVYVNPNEDDCSFIRTLFNVIVQYSSGLLLIGGDFHCVMSQLKDRQPASLAPPSKTSRIPKHLSRESGFVDVWRSKFLHC